MDAPGRNFRACLLKSSARPFQYLKNISPALGYFSSIQGNTYSIFSREPQLYMRGCPSLVGRLVGWSVVRSETFGLRAETRRRAAIVVYSNLFISTQFIIIHM